MTSPSSTLKACLVATLIVAGCGGTTAGPESANPGQATTSEQGDGLDYAPQVDRGTFTADVDNEHFPLPVGASWAYEVTTAEGAVDRLDVAVTDQTRTVLGVETRIVQVTLTVAGEIEEVTESWYAQDDTGAVWLFGEIDEGYEAGELVETTTWEAGIDRAQPGIVMLAVGATDEIYRVGYLAGEMEERGRLVATDATVGAGQYRNVWIVENWSDLEPDVVERKHYAAGIGLVFADSEAPDSDTIELLTTSLAADDD